MTEHIVPVAKTLPTGKLEWAGNAHFMYGVDQAGNVFRIRPSGRRAPKPGLVMRFMKRLHLV